MAARSESPPPSGAPARAAPAPASADAALDRARADALAYLATFPEQNPNLVVELDAAGRVTYLNPIARTRFPDLADRGAAHPLLAGVPACGAALRRDGAEFAAREVEVGNAVFEQKICASPSGDTRVYVHDVTARKRAEEAIQRLAQRVVTAQEDERRRIARELHDDAGQALTALRIGLELIRSELPPDAEALRADLSRAAALAEETHARIRRLARGLRPPALDDVGLGAAVAALCREFASHTQLAVDCAPIEPPALRDEARVALYRVVQEALANVVRHSGARRVAVTLAADDAGVRATVADDGVGFDLAAVRPDGLGLPGLRERLALLGGRLDITSAPGAGTRLEAWVPGGDGGAG